MEPISQYGYEKLTKELKQLKEIERPKIIKEIDTAREHGDLKENAEYHAAKERQLFIDARIKDLSTMLTNAQVIDPSTLPHDKVSFGSTIEIIDLDTQKPYTYTIVGSIESDTARGLISYGSPIAKALLGKEVGDEVAINLPRGECEFEIMKIHYKPIVF
ncbi:MULTISPECIES: transcription elongation factor GreA [Helicobacter]|uniref:Transcription elongation factor GreA n=2 Tax=Helicobacter TaxID=209 RepID=A0A377J5E8_9HELI|nr:MULTISPECIES: transcription elongation factor GreA [Helicobacter]MDL0080382.1 transcription elongation factor GreA [Helicobacter sp. CPD2-1]MDL0082467.1 transcription elongation factor GreA [Helicobacter sp. XJK30-2]STO97525.1 transcription elongation factor [Helicobacter canis]